jgi:hypothetical protein
MPCPLDKYKVPLSYMLNGSATHMPEGTIGFWARKLVAERNRIKNWPNLIGNSFLNIHSKKGA